MTLKAYAVIEEFEGNGAIFFATHDIEARKRGADEFGDGDLRGISCRRAPWADKFADGKLPASVMIENGWRFDCCSCGATIDEDYLNEQDLPIEGVVGFMHTMVYCNAVCEATYDLDRAIAKQHEERALRHLTTWIKKRFPSVKFSSQPMWKPHAYACERDGTWVVDQIVVSFKYPGAKYGLASVRVERRQHNHKLIGPIRPQFSCAGGDRETFEAWVEAEKQRRKADAERQPA